MIANKTTSPKRSVDIEVSNYRSNIKYDTKQQRQPVNYRLLTWDGHIQNATGFSDNQPPLSWTLKNKTTY